LAQTLDIFSISEAVNSHNKYPLQQLHRNLAEKLGGISPEMLDDAEEKLMVAENKLKKLEKYMKLFDNTWDILLNQGEEIIDGFTDDFCSFSSETAKSKLNSGNSKQPTDTTVVGGETTFTEKNNSLTSSVDIKSVFEKDWKPFDLPPDTSNQYQRLPKISQDVWPPLASTILSEDIQVHAQKHWWGVINRTTAKRNQINFRKSARDRLMKLLTCSSVRPLSS